MFRRIIENYLQEERHDSNPPGFISIIDGKWTLDCRTFKELNDPERVVLDEYIKNHNDEKNLLKPIQINNT